MKRAPTRTLAALALVALPQTTGQGARPAEPDGAKTAREVVDIAPPAEAEGPSFTLEIVDEAGERLREAQYTLVDMERRGAWGPLVVWSSRAPVPGFARVPLSVLERLGGGPPRRIDAVLQPESADAPRVSLPPELAAGGVVTLRVPREREWTQRAAVVEVVDADGRPLAGVPVSCGAFTRADGDALVSDGERRTDERGRVEVRPALHPRRALAEQDVRVVARLPLSEPLAARLGPATDFGAPLTLRVPPTGSLRVALDGGAPATSVVAVTVADAARPAGAPDPVGGRSAYAAAPGGVALFPIVGLGLELELELTDPPSGGRTTSVVRGPTRTGETVEVEISPDGSFSPPRVRFRALDAGGRPLAGGEVNAISRCEAPPGVLCITGGSGPNNATARADESGRVSFPLLRAWADGHRHWLELRARVPGAPEREWTRIARADVPFALRPGEVRDLADVVFDTAPLVLTGTVVHPDGAPAGGAAVSVWAIAPDETRAERRERRERGEPSPVAGLEGPWSARSDPAGRFRVAVTTPTPRLSVEVSRGAARSPRREVEADGGELRLELPRTGVFAARVVLDPGFFSDDLRFVLRGEGGEHFLFASGVDAMGAPRRWDVGEEVAAGRYAVEVRAGHTWTWPVARIEGVEVATGEGPVDARLDPLDLRGALARTTLRLLAPDGAPLRGGLVARVDGEEQGIAADADGTLTLILPSSAATIELETDGFAPLRVDLRSDSRAERELRFERR